MSRPNPMRKPRRGPLGRVKPSYLVLLALLPLIVLLYVREAEYQAALRFLIPGLNYTIAVTVLAYLLASMLGLALAGMMLLKLGRLTVPLFLASAALLMATGSAARRRTCWRSRRSSGGGALDFAC